MPEVNDNIYLLIIFGIAGTFLLSAGIIYFVTSYMKKVARQKVELQKAEMEYQARLFTAVIQTQEEEQRKIGREMHDAAGSILSSVRHRLSKAAMEKGADIFYNENIQAVDQLHSIIRNISHLLSPPELEMAGFHDAVENLCGNFADTHDTEIILQDEVPGFIPKNKFQVSLSLYRILQELITNTIKHAAATVINILIKNENNVFVIDYKDNGKGTDGGEMFTGGLGMQSIQSRLIMIHASHRIETSAGKGFRFIIYLNHQDIFQDE